MEWAGRILSVAIEMMAPAIAGYYLDQWWGTGFLAVVGFGLGFALGMFHLLAMTGSLRPPTKKPD